MTPRGVRREPLVSPALALPLLLLLVVPAVLLVARTTPAALSAAMRDRETLQAIGLSLSTSAAALAASIALGTPLAYWLAHTRSRAGALVETLVDLPIVLPPAVAGVALLLTLGRSGPIGSWLASIGVEVAFTPAAVVIAQVFVASPYFVRTARAGFAAVDRSQREAATLLGASRWTEFRRVLAPQSASFLAAGAAICWSRALGEFGATIIFAGNLPGRTQTMPLAVYIGFEIGLDRALVLSTLLIALSLLVLLTVRLTGRRPIGPLG